MAADTKIPYVDYTYNPWFGCEPVHPGCQHCYAKPYWARLHVPPGRRKRKAASQLRQPYDWDRSAERGGVRYRVMLGSLMDFFEDHPDVVEWRQEVFRMMRDTPHLDWIIPTKRPKRIEECWPEAKLPDSLFDKPSRRLDNVCLLASVSDQETFDRGAHALYHGCRDLARTLGLSLEPLVGPIKLWHDYDGEKTRDWQGCFDWLVIGGESGRGARVCQTRWIYDLVRQGQQAGVAVYVKQMGARHLGPAAIGLAHPKGADPAEWPEDLRIQEYPAALTEKETH